MTKADELVSPSDDLIRFAITEEYGERCSTFDPDCYTCQAWSQYDRLSAQQREPVVRVKELEWTLQGAGRTEMQIATHPLLSIAYGVGASTYKPGWHGLFRGYEFLGDYETETEAKSAAQADYEQRIMTAIEITSSNGGVDGHADLCNGQSPRASHICRELGEAGIKPGPLEAFADVSVDELARLIAGAIGICVDDDKSGVWIHCHPAARALLDRYKIERLDRLASSGRRG